MGPCSDNCQDFHRFCGALKSKSFLQYYKKMLETGTLDAFGTSRNLPPTPSCDDDFYKMGCPKTCFECKLFTTINNIWTSVSLDYWNINWYCAGNFAPHFWNSWNCTFLEAHPDFSIAKRFGYDHEDVWKVTALGLLLKSSDNWNERLRTHFRQQLERKIITENWYQMRLN